MQTFRFDPIDDPRWLALVESHPVATTFHHPGWMRALRKTYGYRFIGLTTAAPGEPMRDGAPFGLVKSSLTGTRLVSLPFADHCTPLVDGPAALAALLCAARDLAREHRCAFAEVRPLEPIAPEVLTQAGAGPSFESKVHVIDLSPTEEAMFKACSEAAIQRNIKKAQKRLRYEHGTSDELLDAFFHLMVITRRKHRLPPQPRQWFRNVLDELPGTKVHVTYLDQQPSAAIFTARFGRRYMYKYGASDTALMNHGGSPFLIWQGIREAKAAGFPIFDMGRTEIGHEGLATFKERFNAVPVPLMYYRSPAPKVANIGRDKGLVKLAEPIFARLPDKMLIAAGRMLYRHMG
jgi:CelD/BcsL family acetyltransferase involved in cellulose biosynthesis